MRTIIRVWDIKARKMSEPFFLSDIRQDIEKFPREGFEVMLHSGATDYKGNGLFVSDIVEVEYDAGLGIGDRKIVGIIEREHTSFQIDFPQFGESTDRFFHDECVIRRIGDIYRSPELEKKYFV